MIRRYYPELLFAAFLSLLLLVAYAFRGTKTPSELRTPRPIARVEALFLLEVQHPQGQFRVSPEGVIEVAGRRISMNLTELRDFRQAVERLEVVMAGSGPARLRFYTKDGLQELSFQPEGPPPEVEQVLQHLRLHGALPANTEEPAREKAHSRT